MAGVAEAAGSAGSWSVESAAAGCDSDVVTPSGGPGRREVSTTAPGEEEPQHEIGLDPLDGVAVDERVGDGDAADVGPALDLDADVAEQHELAGRPREGTAGIEARHRGKLAFDAVDAGFQPDRMPDGVDGHDALVVADDDDEVVGFERERAERGRGGILHRLPRDTVQLERLSALERFPEVGGIEQPATGHPGIRVGIHPDRHKAMPPSDESRVRPLGQRLPNRTRNGRPVVPWFSPLALARLNGPSTQQS